MNKVLILAVHPDDETLGCGGSLLKHKKKGDKIYWLIATSIKSEQGFKKDEIARRDKEIKSVANMYGFEAVKMLDIPTTQVKEFPKQEMVKSISTVFKAIKPNILYLPFNGDVHSDHKVIFEAAYSCTKTFRYPFLNKVLMMETISETEFAPPTKDSVFVPNYFVDISEFIAKKIEIMKIFKNEIGRHPFPRSVKNIKTLATFRGATAGFKYAESFMVLKELSK
ncbi:MAG: PIG-L family deacetylase [Candidatus Omnitrophica bacterium]|nr:PIG-L family deacetylase [Candidatus Omnitrophota bacterium]